jgi:hypothetical protein
MVFEIRERICFLRLIAICIQAAPDIYRDIGCLHNLVAIIVINIAVNADFRVKS